MSQPCHDMQERILDFTLGALDADQVREVQSHLNTCDACRRHMQTLTEQGEALAAFGRQVQADMDARRDRVIETLQNVAPAGAGATKIVPLVGRFVKTGVAAVLVLGVGILIGRLTSSKPVDVERLHADLRSSIVASLQPAIRKSVLADVDERMESALAASDQRVRAEVVEQVRQDLRIVATDLMAGSEQLVDRRFAEVVELIEAARQTDRRQVAKALDQLKTQTGIGFMRLASLTDEMSPARQNQ